MNPRCLVRAALTFASSCWAAAVLAQTHSESFDRYMVRSTVLTAAAISEQAARRHGIERAEDLGILNVTVTRGEDALAPTVRARVLATSQNLLGQTDSIAMREIIENKRVTYMGTFEFEPARIRRFRIEVQPHGSAEVFTQRFEQRLFSLPP